ncbi:Rz-like lysis system protein LysB [Erwiniaceae bacterium BAC15a-03b]|uniref:Rz-like lysis system protein LysB n=1 Tax=Winslowiella arboricola TaxID=2978220 RepID=A0A9J6PQ70_9GAMM|nr:Rz-like lysis system protein LysB [Winslowiella arboricola]MCU5773076.1 Rz-like lysis system protein LysB [Winslowiella arboricola]MCU5777829.1 Rz-like lysis system protein LysB [Winslowiella arboricola]
MRNLLMAGLLILFSFAGVQSWRLSNAHQTIETQGTTITSQGTKLTQKNSQLIALSILTETSSREQTRLYATAEDTHALLRKRQQKIEDLTRENDELKRWAATTLPDVISRLRQRPAFTGGEDYRKWLSEADPLQAGSGKPAQ